MWEEGLQVFFGLWKLPIRLATLTSASEVVCHQMNEPNSTKQSYLPWSFFWWLTRNCKSLTSCRRSRTTPLPSRERALLTVSAPRNFWCNEAALGTAELVQNKLDMSSAEVPGKGPLQVLLAIKPASTRNKPSHTRQPRLEKAAPQRFGAFSRQVGLPKKNWDPLPQCQSLQQSENGSPSCNTFNFG